ncbi:MAG: lamin tail domain-containing protein [Roseibacillus sp.]
MNSIRSLASTAVLIALTLCASPNAHGTLHITEFMADNKNTLQDGDDDASDWIEIFNSGPQPVNMEGYFLTDEIDALTKWSFPSVEITENGFLLVFASGKDRSIPGAELHTSFKLSSDGEYLALVAPDGSSVVAEFGTEDNPLPEQFEDASYGLMQGGGQTPTVFIGSQQQAKVLIPSDDALGGDWTAQQFQDSQWASAQMGIGYDENSTYSLEFGTDGNLGNEFNGVNTSVYIRVPFEVDDPSSITKLTLKMKYDDGFVAYLNDTLVADANAPGGLTWNSEATGNHSDGEAVVFQDSDITSFAHILGAGTNILAIHGLNDNITSSDMLITAELHGTRITDPSLGGPGYLETPSPRGFNGDTFDGFVSDTSFSVDRGFFEEAFDLEITSATEGAEIRYTLDGSPPSPTRGQVYAGAIRITGTTVVRAMAHQAGLRPTNVDTQTYLFAEDVVDQSRMRTAVTQSATLGPQMIDSLKSVPTISIVTDNPGPFMNESGGNIRSESPASVEMIFPDGTRGFQEDGGLKHFGGYYTNFRKKNFRIGFRSQYGATKINYPLFDGFDYKHYPPTERFDIMDLRSGSHDMNSRGAYMSNRFTDDSMLDMGNLAPHGRFVHVYLNGSYWGQYHLRERWNADMASSYFGGPKADYDAVNLNDGFRNDEKVYDGTGVFWNEAKALATGPNPWANNNNNIDVANLIDFMLLWVSGNSESEVRLLGSKAQGQPFRFQMKDADGFLRSPGHSASSAGPLSLMSRLRSGNTDFAMLVADRIHMHFFNDGALTPSQNIERLQKRVDEARPGFIAESARWGNRFREYQNWLSYQQNLVNNHFPGLTRTMISRFKSAGMYPDTDAPVFSQYGGSVLPITPVTMATDADRIYYTLDGSDPRLPGGAPNPAALTAVFGGAGPAPVTYLTTGHTWKYLDDGSNQGTAWRSSSFIDTTWASGPSALGYGGDGEATPVSPGPDSSNKFATTYFRTTVEIPDPSIFLHFLLRLRYDDAAAVYLNGNEIIRTPNLPAGATSGQYANSDNGNESSWFDYNIPTASFLAGINTLAVEIHQGDGQSSDIRLDMILRGETSQGGGDNVSDPVFFTEPTLLSARAYNTGTGEWSALNEAFFTINTVPADGTNLVVSELHYHPTNPSTPAELAVSNDRDDFEFLEFLNIGPTALDLTGVRFDSGINFTFPDHTIMQVGERLLLIRNRAGFEARYGPLAGVQAFDYTGRFSNDGEAVVITGVSPDPIISFTYNDQVPWPTTADGLGPSMSLLDPFAQPPHGDAASWEASRQPGGTPGAAEPASITYAAWSALHGIQGGPDDDDDGDGISNFLEFLYGSRPDLASDAPVPSAAIQSIEVGGVVDDYLTLTFRQNLDADASVTVEVSLDLVTWSSDPALFDSVSAVYNGDGTATVTVRLADPVGSVQERIFLRLRGS